MTGGAHTDGQRLATAIELIEDLFPGMHWILAKGKVHPREPLYGIRVFAEGDVDNIVAEGESDDLVECVQIAATGFHKSGMVS